LLSAAASNNFLCGGAADRIPMVPCFPFAHTLHPFWIDLIFRSPLILGTTQRSGLDRAYPFHANHHTFALFFEPPSFRRVDINQRRIYYRIWYGSIPKERL
jgi:hypothetical protein